MEGSGKMGRDGLDGVSSINLFDHPQPASFYEYGLTLFSPYGTDPISPKVQSMIECYEAHSFPEDDNFGDITIYIKQ